MVKKANILDCKKCKHLYVTYDKFYPWGCKAFGLNQKNILIMKFTRFLA